MTAQADQSVTTRRKVRILLANGWIHTEVNVAEFSAALDVPSKTFKARLSSWPRQGRQSVYIVGGHVIAWGWE